MPKGFTDCVENNGRVRRVSGPNKKLGLKKGEFVNFCFTKAGKSFRGETHQAKSQPKISNIRKQLGG